MTFKSFNNGKQRNRTEVCEEEESLLLGIGTMNEFFRDGTCAGTVAALVGRLRRRCKISSEEQSRSDEKE